MPSVVRMLIALSFGLALGIAVAVSGCPRLAAIVSYITPVGMLWINTLKMTVIPLVVSLVIVGVAAAAENNALARIGVRMLAVFLVLLIGAACITAVAAPSLFAYLPMSSAAPTAHAMIPSPLPVKTPNLTEWLLQLVPANPIHAAAEGATLPLVIFCLLFAIAVTRIRPDQRRTVTTFFEAVRDTMLVLVRWIVALAPLGVFALVLGVASQIGLPLAGAVAYFLGVLALIILIHIALLYLIASFGGRAPALQFARAVFPAQVVAVSSRSSLACLPALVEGAQDVLRVPASTSALVLPLAVSTFKLNVPISWTIGAIFLARLYGFDFDYTKIAMLAAISVLLSFGSPGIPHGALVLKVPVLLSFGFPAGGVALLVGTDLLPDIIATLLNVTADMTVAAVVSRDSRQRILSPALPDAAITTPLP